VCDARRGADERDCSPAAPWWLLRVGIGLLARAVASPCAFGRTCARVSAGLLECGVGLTCALVTSANAATVACGGVRALTSKREPRRRGGAHRGVAGASRRTRSGASRGRREGVVDFHRGERVRGGGVERGIDEFERFVGVVAVA